MKFNRKQWAISILIGVFGVPSCIIASLSHKHKLEIDTQNWLQRLQATQISDSSSEQVALFLNHNKLNFSKEFVYSQYQKTGPPPYLILTAEAEPVTTFDWYHGFSRQHIHLIFEFKDDRLESWSVETPESLI